MSEFGGLDIGMPEEGQGGASEALSEEARQRFAAAQAAAQQARREERKAKKRDDGVAQAIMQFLTDQQRTHLATLIARIVARDCPSPFILAVLSLINAPCAHAIDEWLKERNVSVPDDADAPQQPSVNATLDADATAAMGRWILRLELSLALESPAILDALLLDDSNIDGTLLQLTTFVLQDFLRERKQTITFEQTQAIAVRILQSLFGPYLHAHLERRQQIAEQSSNEDD